jgi:hypothetical protein
MRKGTGNVSEERNNISVDVTTESKSGGFTYPTPLLRMMPAVTFGLRAAALAGMAVSAGAIAFGLAGVFDDSTNVAFTTCCGGKLPSAPPVLDQ